MAQTVRPDPSPCKSKVPRIDLALQAEDRVIVLTTAEQEQKVAQALG